MHDAIIICTERNNIQNIDAIDETVSDHLRWTTAQNCAQLPIFHAWWLFIIKVKIIPRSIISICPSNISSNHFYFLKVLFWLNSIMVQPKPIVFPVSLEARLQTMRVNTNSFDTWYPNSSFDLVHRRAATNKVAPYTFGMRYMTARSKSVPKLYISQPSKKKSLRTIE